MRVLARRGHTGPALVVGALVAFLVATKILASTLTSSASSFLGAPDPATGSTVAVGMIIDGHPGALGTGAGVEQGARIAVAYQNEYRDGLNGHKIDLRLCENHKTATGGWLCATDLAHHVAVVVEPFSGQGTTEVPTLAHAGIPYIAMTAGSYAELTTKGAFVLQGGLPAILGAVAMQAKQKGYAKVTLIVENTPAIVQGTQALGGLVFRAAGVGFDVLPADPDATNLEPELQTAVSGGATALGVGGDAGFCREFLRSYAALRLHIPKYVLATCLSPGIVDSRVLDNVLKGSLLAGAEMPSAREDGLYAALVDKYAPSVNSNPNISAADFAGVIPVLSLAAIMKGAPPSLPVTAANILARTESATNVVIPLSGGVTFTCNGTAIPFLKSACSSATNIGVLGTGYRVSHIQSYDPTALY